LPSTAAALRLGAVPVLALARCSVRSFSQAPVAEASAAASKSSSTVRIVFSSGGSKTRNSGSYRTPSEAMTCGGASAIHSPIAANERAPANTAATAMASSDVSGCRNPRASRGSGTNAR
jgi:uncharacterized lipoprotein